MEDETETWVRFSEVGINARMRNALELFALRKEKGEQLSPPVCDAGRVDSVGLELSAPAAVGLGGWGSAAGASTSAEDGGADGEELKRA
jgi:hypothetical protein